MELATDPQGNQRCRWGTSTPRYLDYHDNEWGLPERDDFRLYEKICLEGFQSGLSWLTILNKRENFRAAFADFDFNKVAEFTSADEERLVQDAGIIRHRGKIRSAIGNASRAQALVAEFGSLSAFFWQYAQPIAVPTDLPSKTAASIQLSKDLRKRGWTFIGPTTAYAFMQAMGLVNDHVEGCLARERCTEARRALDAELAHEAPDER